MVWLWTTKWELDVSPEVPVQYEGGEYVFDFNSFGSLGHTPNRRFVSGLGHHQWPHSVPGHIYSVHQETRTSWK
jgi:hypothetical protein